MLSIKYMFAVILVNINEIKKKKTFFRVHLVKRKNNNMENVLFAWFYQNFQVF